MELCDDGLTLDDRVKHMSTDAERMAVVRQLFEGIEYLHGLKIVHRDLKPANVLFKGSCLKICDMGQSRLLLMDVSLTSAAAFHIALIRLRHRLQPSKRAPLAARQGG